MKNSVDLFKDASNVLVGGVNSPVRAFGSVGGNPIFMKEGKGAYLVSEDGTRYTDYVLSWGPLILGHANTAVLDAIHETLSKGSTFGAPTVLETNLAEEIQRFFPLMRKIRFVNSGTEATMSAIRLARGYTKRNVIVKFDGCYHGHVDSLLVAAGSGNLTLGRADSAGVPDSFVEHTRIIRFNDKEAIDALFKEEGGSIAGVIMEPVCGNMGLVPPKEGFLEHVRQLCSDFGALLIFDEVMTGFRVSLGGAQMHYGVEPDLTCLGKVVGGGLPCAAYGGREEIMDYLAPLGPVYQAGTLSGNPLAMAAGLATLKQLDTNLFNTAKVLVERVCQGISDAAKNWGVPIEIHHIGTMFSLFYRKGRIECLDDVKQCDLDLFAKIYSGLLEEGVYMAPSQFESNFISFCHSDDDINATIAGFNRVFETISKNES